MSGKLKYIHLEDEQAIIKLTQRLLEKEGYIVQCEPVQKREEFLEALKDEAVDLIIADYALPDINGLTALSLLRKQNKELPFILFSGSIGEQKAIDALRKGATDYVLKENVRALGPTVRRAYNEALMEKERKKEEGVRTILQSLAQRLINPLTLKEVGKIIAGEAYKNFKYDAFSLDIVDEANEVLAGVYSEDTLAGDEKPREVPAHNTPLKSIRNKDVLTGKSKLINRMVKPEKSEFISYGDETRLSMSLIFVPVRYKDKAIGIVSIQSYTPGKYSEGDLSLFQTFADLAGGALVRSQMEKKIQASEENLNTILDNLQAGVLLIDEKTHEIIDINPKAAQMFGLPAKDIVGNTCNEFICPNAWGNCPISDLGQDIDNSEKIMVSKDGRQIPVLKSVVKITVDNRPCLLESFLDIREQKAMESEITSFGRILDSTLNEIYIFDAETYHFIKLNHGAKENIGYNENEYRLLTPVDIKPEFTKESLTKFVEPLRLGKEDKLNFTTLHRRKDGSTYPVEVFLQMTSYYDKPAFVAIISDITERVCSEKIRQTMFEIAAANVKIRDEGEFYTLIQQKLSALLDTSNFIIAMYDDQNDNLTVAYMADKKDRIEQFDVIPAQNTLSACVIKNKQPVLLNEDEMADFFNKNNINWVGTAAKCWLGVPLIVDNQSIGIIIVQNYEHSGVFDKQDQNLLEFAAGQLAESIKRKQIESKIYQLSRSVEQSPVTTVITDLQGNIQYVNPKFCQVTGYSFEEAIGQNPRILKSGETAAEEYRKLWDTISKGDVWRGRFHNKKKNGELYWEDASIGPIKNEKGETTHYLAVKEDITERVEAENHLNKLNRQNEILLTSFPSVLMVMDKDEKVIRWNKKAEEIFGLSWQAVRHKQLLELPLSWSWEQVSEGITTSRQNRYISQLTDVPFEKDGGVHGFLNVTIAPFVGAEDIIDGYLIHAEDITEKKIAQGQQAHAQKLESIGRLAAGIAHEINTPAQYVGDNTHFLQDAFNDLKRLLEIFRKMQDASDDREEQARLLTAAKRIAEEIGLDFLIDEIPMAIGQSLDGISKVSRIVRAMKEFSHPGGKEKTLIDLRMAIENTITVSRNEWKYVADMETDFDESLTTVPCFPDEFNQVVLNLIINAAHAIDSKVKGAQSKGTILIKTRKVDDMAEITVKDDGPGIAREIQKKIFDPFFTTKEVGKGTGQGLAISHDVIVNKHGGSISVESTPGEGASFVIQLPLETV